MTKVSEMSKAERSAAYVEILNDGMIKCGQSLELSVEETLDLELRHSVEAYAEAFGPEKTAERLTQLAEHHFRGLLSELGKRQSDA